MPNKSTDLLNQALQKYLRKYIQTTESIFFPYGSQDIYFKIFFLIH